MSLTEAPCLEHGSRRGLDGESLGLLVDIEPAERAGPGRLSAGPDGRSLVKGDMHGGPAGMLCNRNGCYCRSVINRWIRSVEIRFWLAWQFDNIILHLIAVSLLSHILPQPENRQQKQPLCENFHRTVTRWVY